MTDFGTASGGGVFVTSFQAGFTGRRADVIIVDDPHDIETTLSRSRPLSKNLTPCSCRA